MSKFQTRPTFVNAIKITGFKQDAEGNRMETTDDAGFVTVVAICAEPNTAETKEYVVAEVAKLGDYVVYDDAGEMVALVDTVEFDEQYIAA